MDAGPFLKISRGNWSRNHTKKNSNSSMLPWETIISPNNFPAQSIVFPKQEAVIFFSFLFFLIQIPSQSEDRDQVQCIIDDEIFISLVHLASWVRIKVSKAASSNIKFPPYQYILNAHHTVKLLQLVNDHLWSINWWGHAYIWPYTF